MESNRFREGIPYGGVEAIPAEELNPPTLGSEVRCTTPAAQRYRGFSYRQCGCARCVSDRCSASNRLTGHTSGHTFAMSDNDTTTGNAAEADHEVDDVARLFREHDNVGPDSSIWLRAIGQLIRHGKPLGQAVALVFKAPDLGLLPFGIVTATENNRLVFWPVLPSGVDMPCGDIEAVDHITLEVPSGRSHVTGYKNNRESIHHTQAWKLHHFPGTGLDSWFIFLVKLSVLREQSQAVQRKVAMPTTDKERRVEEVSRFIQRLKIAHVALPDGSAAGDYIAAAVYLVTGTFDEQTFSGSVFPADVMAPEVNGWPNGPFELGRAKVAVGTTTIAVAAARPPGTLKEAISLGFPRHAG